MNSKKIRSYHTPENSIRVLHSSFVNENGNISLIYEDGSIFVISPYDAAKLISVLKASIEESISITKSLIE